MFLLMSWVSILLFGLHMLGKEAVLPNQLCWSEGMRRVLWRSSLPCLLFQLGPVPDAQGGFMESENHRMAWSGRDINAPLVPPEHFLCAQHSACLKWDLWLDLCRDLH